LVGRGSDTRMRSPPGAKQAIDSSNVDAADESAAWAGSVKVIFDAALGLAGPLAQATQTLVRAALHLED